MSDAVRRLAIRKKLRKFRKERARKSIAGDAITIAIPLLIGGLSVLSQVFNWPAY